MTHVRNQTVPPLQGLASIVRMSCSGVDLGPLGATLVQRASLNPGDANALMDLATVLQLKGDRATALAVQAHAVAIQQHYSLPAPKGTGVRLLAIMGPGDVASNTPLEFLVEDTDITLEMLYLTPTMSLPAVLPEHDVLFIAAAESPENGPLLAHIEALVADWPRPVLNRPEKIARMSRDGVCAALRTANGVSIPVTARANRELLAQVAAGACPVTELDEDASFPLIVRPVGSQAGRGLSKVDTKEELLPYLAERPEHDFYVSRFVDYRSPDGRFRKYRVALVRGEPFICHLGISDHWMIHYINAGMLESAEKRAEEARVMATFYEDFAPRHEEALREIDERFGLDYLVIDCGETPDGKLLVFEVDSAAVVHAVDSVELFPYKQAPMRIVREAFRQMLADAIEEGS